MRSLVWTILALGAVGASTGCGGGGDDDGAGGGSGESSAISFDESNALAASSGSVVAMAVAAELGGLIGSAIGTLADTPPPASSSSFATKADIDLSCPAGGTARLSYNQVAVGQQATIAFTGCVGSVFSGQAIDGTIEIEIEAITGSIIGAFPSEGTATVNLTAGSDITITGSFKVLASLSGVLVDLSLGNQLGTDILTITRNTPSGAQTIEFACFKIRQVISVLTGTIDGAFEPVGVARINGSQVFSLNDYSSTPPSLTITKGVATSGSANMSSGDASASVTFINLPYCIPFGETPSGDNSFVANEFRGEACVEVTGQDSAGNPIDYETTWGKLLNADFTPGGATCDTTTNATPGPETCDFQGTDRLPIADTYITGTGPEPDRMLADTNFGADSRLLTKSVPNLGYTRKTYIVFDLSDRPANVQNATLVLTLERHVEVAGEPSGPWPFNVYGITDDDDWDPDALAEDEITWNNAPRNVNSSVLLFEESPGVPLLIGGYDFMLGGVYDQDNDGIDDPGTRYAFDLTDYINERIENDADGKITILIAHTNPTGANVNTSVFFSKENDEECDRPFLRLADAPVMPPTEPPTHSPNPLENQFVMATTPSAPGSTLEAWISRDGLQWAGPVYPLRRDCGAPIVIDRTIAPGLASTPTHYLAAAYDTNGTLHFAKSRNGVHWESAVEIITVDEGLGAGSRPTVVYDRESDNWFALVVTFVPGLSPYHIRFLDLDGRGSALSQVPSEVRSNTAPHIAYTGVENREYVIAYTAGNTSFQQAFDFFAALPFPDDLVFRSYPDEILGTEPIPSEGAPWVSAILTQIFTVANEDRIVQGDPPLTVGQNRIWQYDVGLDEWTSLGTLRDAAPDHEGASIAGVLSDMVVASPNAASKSTDLWYLTIDDRLGRQVAEYVELETGSIKTPALAFGPVRGTRNLQPCCALEDPACDDGDARLILDFFIRLRSFKRTTPPDPGDFDAAEDVELSVTIRSELGAIKTQFDADPATAGFQPLIVEDATLNQGHQFNEGDPGSDLPTLETLLVPGDTVTVTLTGSDAGASTAELSFDELAAPQGAGNAKNTLTRDADGNPVYQLTYDASVGEFER